MDVFKAMKLHEKTKKVQRKIERGRQVNICGPNAGEHVKDRVMRRNQRKRLRNDQGGRRITTRVWGPRSKCRKCFKGELSIVSNIPDRSHKIRLRITILLAFVSNAVMNLLVNVHLWRLLVSFGYNSRNVKKDQRVDQGLRLLMKTQMDFSGGKSRNQKDPLCWKAEGEW